MEVQQTIKLSEEHLRELHFAALDLHIQALKLTAREMKKSEKKE